MGTQPCSFTHVIAHASILLARVLAGFLALNISWSQRQACSGGAGTHQSAHRDSHSVYNVPFARTNSLAHLQPHLQPLVHTAAGPQRTLQLPQVPLEVAQSLGKCRVAY